MINVRKCVVLLTRMSDVYRCPHFPCTFHWFPPTKQQQQGEEDRAGGENRLELIIEIFGIETNRMAIHTTYRTFVSRHLSFNSHEYKIK